MRIDFSEVLVSLECVSCSITFAITGTTERQLRESQRTFTCPNGHSQSYKGILEIEALRKEVGRLREAIVERDSRLADRWTSIQERDRRIASLKGVVSKLKKQRELTGAK